MAGVVLGITVGIVQGGWAIEKLPVARFNPPPLMNQTMRVIEGTKVIHEVGGESYPSCRYTISISVPPGVPALEQHEVKNDPNTCTMTLVEGVPMDAVDGNPNPPVPNNDTSGRFARAVGGDSPTQIAIPLRAPDEFSRGQYYAWVKDPAPANIRVTESWSIVSWEWGGASAFFSPRNPNPDGDEPACWAHTDAFQQTGWNRTDFDVNCNRDDDDPDYVETATKVHWKNGAFCMSIDTDVDFNRSRGRGWHDGVLQGLTTRDIYGGCSGLLSFHDRLDRLIN